MLGGYPNFLLMEDFEFIRRAMKHGLIKIMHWPAPTSSRRWRSVSVWKTTMINWTMVFLYMWGVHPNTLARWYYSFGNKKV